MTDDRGSKVFDMPHARVTLTPIGPGIEIEVWPKAGQSAYAVIDPTVAVRIAKHLVELASAQLTVLRLADDDDDDTDEGAATDEADGPDEDDTSDNVVDLFSRRRPDR